MTGEGKEHPKKGGGKKKGRLTPLQEKKKKRKLPFPGRARRGNGTKEKMGGRFLLSRKKNFSPLAIAARLVGQDCQEKKKGEGRRTQSAVFLTGGRKKIWKKEKRGGKKNPGRPCLRRKKERRTTIFSTCHRGIRGGGGGGKVGPTISIHQKRRGRKKKKGIVRRASPERSGKKEKGGKGLAPRKGGEKKDLRRRILRRSCGQRNFGRGEKGGTTSLHSSCRGRKKKRPFYPRQGVEKAPPKKGRGAFRTCPSLEGGKKGGTLCVRLPENMWVKKRGGASLAS